MDQKLLIGGELVDAENGATFDNINPATEEVIGQIGNGSAGDMSRAVAAARTAFDETDWATNHEFRKECLLQIQAAIESELEEFRQELIDEVGCPLLTTYGPQLDAPLREALIWPAEMIEQFEWRRSIGTRDAFGTGDNEREVWKEPIGVVGTIVPWNFPMEITLNKLGPILAMGNTLVLKPAPDTSANATRLARLIAEKTDVPAGVVNIVPSQDHLVGEVITTSPDVDMVAFTGSSATGKRIMEASASTLKPVFLELGGKSANIYLDDCDESAFGGAVFSCMHGGQGCAIPTRLLIPRDRYDAAVEQIAAAFAGWGYGDPNDAANMQGPQVSKKQQDRVLEYIEKGKAEGARVVTGGGRPAHLEKGYYVEPTLFADVDNSMTIAQEEIFGPVICAIPYDTEEDAIRIANDSPFGLSGNIFSGDLERAKGVAAQIRTGTLGLNGGVWYGPDAPFGGYKTSGIGRQCGIEGLEIFTETKTVGWPV
ncbi:MAG: aldehyde dehydrogenase family protein [Actinomycetota bacterium]